ncbi:MAG: transcription antitermination factor NusB [Pseudomonadales bacterium]
MNPGAAKHVKPWLRSLSRRLLLQALYQWQLTGAEPGEIEHQFEDQLARADREYFSEILRGVIAQQEALDACIEPALDRRVKELDHVERAILRLGTYELMHRPDVPFRVIINEAVNLARSFGATDGHRYVNGVLDRLARELRASEVDPADG